MKNNQQNFDNHYGSPQNDQNPNLQFNSQTGFFNKELLRNRMLEMSKEQRETYEKTELPEAFVKSDQMPSMQSKSTLIIFTVLNFILGLAFQRFYIKQYLLGAIQFTINIIPRVLITYFIVKHGFNGYFFFGEGGALWIVSYSMGVIVFIWAIIDIVLAAQGKMKDNLGRKVDL